MKLELIAGVLIMIAVILLFIAGTLMYHFHPGFHKTTLALVAAAEIVLASVVAVIVWFMEEL